MKKIIRRFLNFLLCLGFLLVPALEGSSPPVPMEEAGLRHRAADYAAALDDVHLAAQVIITGIDGSSSLQKDSAEILSRIAPGGVMLFKYNIKDGLHELQALTSQVNAAIGGIPPFVAVDHEGGSVNRFGSLLSRLPAPGYYQEAAMVSGAAAAQAQVYEDAFRAGTELRSLGINLNFAPVVEALDPENAAFLGDRAYGSEGEFAAACATAFASAMRAAAVAPVAKHFPGSGRADPHEKVPVLPYSREILESKAAPFRKIIASETPAAIMLSHCIVPAIDPDHNASLSPLVVRWLREDLGFTGIILGDDYSMSAISSRGYSHEDAVVAALAAGVDMVMTWPPNIRSVHARLLRELGQNPGFRTRLQEAAARIIYEKLRLGLMEAPLKSQQVF